MGTKFDNLIPLVINCLLDKPLKNCPFCEFRQKSLLKRIELINEKENSEKIKMYNHHLNCYFTRVKKEQE
ncbi:MAG: hypothetical protein A2033_12810 [Bacteroidetes bacterium GWA2_31_9]|nr:MAG: hypothetical protein A2033_12810 [Bacteroidetes bacterium GWA2_31_9]